MCSVCVQLVGILWLRKAGRCWCTTPAVKSWLERSRLSTSWSVQPQSSLLMVQVWSELFEWPSGMLEVVCMLLTSAAET